MNPKRSRSTCPSNKTKSKCNKYNDCKWISENMKCRKISTKSTLKKKISTKNTYDTYTFSFKVNMKSDSDSINKFTPGLMKKLIEWYNDNTDNIFLDFGVKTLITKIGYKGDTIQMTVKTADIEGTKKIMDYTVNPDRDGNYPLKYKHKDYLISGNFAEARKSLKRI
jgi:hypothetical protein